MKVNIKLKKVMVFLFAILFVVSSFPTKVDAHRAYFLQVLIDEGQLMYVSNVIKDSELKEANKTEAKLWKYKEGGPVSDYTTFEGEGGPDLSFTFPSRAHKNLGIFNARNNATRKDESRAYAISDTLIPNLNELLLILNNGEAFESLDSLIETSHKLAAVDGGGTVTSRDGKTSIKFESGNHEATVTTEDGGSYQYVVKMKKGYRDEKLEDGKNSPIYDKDFKYPDDVNYLTIGDMIAQANYTYIVKGHSSADLLEYAKPGTLELKLMEFFSSGIASLRSLLGLRDISEIVYNDGIVGSSMYYNGLMPTSWFQKSMSFHMIFQALTWIALGIAIIKLAFQRNLATISASSRVSMMDGIKDLIMAGFLLMAVFLLINLLTGLNMAIVGIFKETAPNYSGFTGEGLEVASFGGVLLQLYYFIITLYLNIIYIVRAISLAVLIAVAPIFVGSIAFQTKNKELFETWGRMLIADIFIQSFHGFILSFFLSIQMSTTRGIELAVISAALIPATKMFKQIITKNSSGVGAGGVGAGLAMAGAAVSGGVGMATGGKFGGGNSNYKGSMDGGAGASGGGGGGGGGGVGFNTLRKEGISANAPDRKTSESAIGNMKRKPGSNEMGSDTGSKAKDTLKENRSNVAFKGSGNLSDIDGRSLSKSALSTAGSFALGGAKVTAGLAAAMALGGEDGGRTAANLIGSGTGDITKGAMTGGSAVLDVGKKGINTLQSDSGNRDISGVETLENGDTAVHRDKNALSQRGLEHANMTDSDNMQLTYDTNKLGENDRANVENIRNKFTEGDTDYLKSRGIENVYDTEDGKTSIEYNEYGKEQLGYSKAYMTEDNMVQVKTPGQELESNLTYDINDKSGPISGTGSGSGAEGTNTNTTGRTRDIYDGPTDGGKSQGGGGNNLNLDDIMS